MGKTNRRETKQGRAERDIVNQPFKSALKDFKVAGLECIGGCGSEIDTRLGYSVVSGRGTRRPARQGYLCSSCEEAQNKKFHVAEWEEDKDTGRFLQYIRVNQGLEVPVYTDDELQSIVDGSVYEAS